MIDLDLKWLLSHKAPCARSRALLVEDPRIVVKDRLVKETIPRYSSLSDLSINAMNGRVEILVTVGSEFASAPERSPSAATTLAHYFWTLVDHELGHLAEVPDTALFRRNMALIPFDVIRDVKLTFKQARPHLLVETRASLLDNKLTIPEALPKAKIERGRRSLYVARKVLHCGSEGRQFDNDLVEEALASIEHIDPWAEIERKLCLVASDRG